MRPDDINKNCVFCALGLIAHESQVEWSMTVLKPKMLQIFLLPTWRYVENWLTVNLSTRSVHNMSEACNCPHDATTTDLKKQACQ